VTASASEDVQIRQSSLAMLLSLSFLPFSLTPFDLNQSSNEDLSYLAFLPQFSAPDKGRRLSKQLIIERFDIP
jgi:hypothetical protein